MLTDDRSTFVQVTSLVSALTIKQNVITLTNAYPVLCRHMAAYDVSMLNLIDFIRMDTI